MSAEFDYVSASHAFGHSGEYRQHDDVTKFMSDIAFVGPSEIGYEITDQGVLNKSRDRYTFFSD